MERSAWNDGRLCRITRLAVFGKMSTKSAMPPAGGPTRVKKKKSFTIADSTKRHEPTEPERVD